MGMQSELFDSPSQVISPDTSRLDPLVWVKRLVIWQDKETVIRDIPFRRGLNIIWSPDPGSDDAVLGQSSGSGHGAGKTLLCRLVRYCLGEDRFSNEELRHVIAGNFPAGLVGAEILVGNRLWCVVRPVGTTRKHWAFDDYSLEEIVRDDPAATGIAPLVNAITRHVFPDNIEQSLPGNAANKAWLYALGWMSRDQECRFDHLLDWRHAEADTDSPIRDLSKEDILQAVRLYLNLISTEEITVRKEQDNLPNQDKIKRDIDYHRRTIDRLTEELIEGLRIVPITQKSDPLVASTYEKAARANAETIKGSLPSAGLSEEAQKKQERLNGLNGQAATLKEKIQGIEDHILLQDKNVVSLNSEKGRLDGDALKARYGDFCPICSVPIDNALAEGCGLSHKLMDGEKIERDKGRVQADIANCLTVKTSLESEKRRHENTLAQVNREIADLGKAFDDEVRQGQAKREEHLKKVFQADQLISKGKNLSAFIDKKSKLEQSLINRDADAEKLKKQRDKLRQKHQAAMTRLNELFQYVARGTLDSYTTSGIELQANKLVANVTVGGAAMTSFKVLIFDLCALLLTIEGKTHLPSFLLHDSPREADLGIHYYHKLFLFMKELEDLGTEPPFQYIITTTTEPPKSLVNSDCHVITLDGADAEQRLLKRNLMGEM